MNSSSLGKSLSNTYQSLVDPRSIRLITLLPGSSLDPVCIELDIVSIDSFVTYEALSYAWDHQKPSAPVSCGEHTVLVTQNVHDALLELRSVETVRCLWIDQVCIDQKDLVERSKQVSLMGHIYARAQRVIIWLGLADHHTASAFDTIRKLTTMYECSYVTGQLFFVGPAKDIKTAVEFYCADRSEKVRAAMLNLPVINSPEFQCLLELLRRSWFKRMWVFQEVVLASDLTEFRCGPYSSDIRDFHRAMDIFHDCNYDDYLSVGERRSSGDAVAISRMGDMLRRGRDSEVTKLDLEILLVHTKMLCCQDPRDKVYATLGICDPKYLPYITPDYAQPLADVYCTVAKAMLGADCALTLLGHVQWFDARPSDLPSWVPDWRETRAAFGTILGLRSSSRTRYFNVCNYQPIQAVQTANPFHLALRGTRFRRITRPLRDRITLRGEDIPLDADRYSYPHWCDMYRAEAARLEIPQSCVRTRGYGVTFVDDILCPRVSTEKSSSETHLAAILRRTLTADLYPRPINSRRDKNSWQRAFPHCVRWAQASDSTNPTPEVLREHDLHMDQVVRSRLLFIAGDEPDDAHLCLASCDTMVGDLICILPGGDVPYVIRERPSTTDQSATEKDRTWEFICECYVDGIMDGEVFQEFYDPKMDTFVLD